MSFVKIGLMMLALCLVSCQARRCFNCSMSVHGSGCGTGDPARGYASANCQSGFNYCGMTTVTENGRVTDVMRGCVRDVVRGTCQSFNKDGVTVRSCSETCAWDNCNIKKPLQWTTTTTTTTRRTTTQSNNGAGDVAASRILVLAVGGISALVALKL